MIRIVRLPQYDSELREILKERTIYFSEQGIPARELNKKFLADIKTTLTLIKAHPFQGVDFPYPVKKILTSDGNSQCAILYSLLPVEHNQDVEKVEEILLNSIMRTNSGSYNDYVSDLKIHCEYSED